jgi:hypothetical protein
MQNAELLAKRPSDNEQWFDQCRQVGQVLDELPDACLKPASVASTTREID